jgi:hypothetical protein
VEWQSSTFLDQGGWIGKTPDPFFSIRIVDVALAYPHIYQNFPEALSVDLRYQWEISNYASVYEHNSFYSNPDNLGIALLPNKNKAMIRIVASVLYEGWNSSPFTDLMEEKYIDAVTGINRFSIDGENCGEHIIVFSYYPTVFGGFTYYTNGVY